MSFKSPKEIVSAVNNIGCAKAGLPWDKLLILGFLAGAFIAFGGLLAIIVGGGMPTVAAVNPGLKKFFFGAVFPQLAETTEGLRIATGYPHSALAFYYLMLFTIWFVLGWWQNRKYGAGWRRLFPGEKV